MLTYFSSNWGDLSFPYPAFIRHISLLNLTRSFIVISGEILVIFFILFPFEIFSRRNLGISLVIFLLFYQFLGLYLGNLTEIVSAIIAVFSFFLLPFLEFLRPHISIILSSYIMTYIFCILYNVNHIFITMVILLEVIGFHYVVILMEMIYFDHKKSSKNNFINQCKQSRILDLANLSLHVSFPLTILICQLTFYDLFHDAHTIGSIFHNTVPLIIFSLWAVATAYNGFYLGIVGERSK